MLEHQTAKFKLSEQFRFSGHPWGPWERQSSGVICIWKFFSAGFLMLAPPGEKNCSLQIEASCHLYYFSWLKSDIITFQSHKSMILKEIHSFNPWFWNISIKKRSLCGWKTPNFNVDFNVEKREEFGVPLWKIIHFEYLRC